MFSGFMTDTWIVSSIAAVVAGLVGLFVVQRGSAFAAHALPLSAFPGAAAASVVGVNPILGMIAFSGLGVAGIARLGDRSGRDVGTALTLVALLGLGALFLALGNGYALEIYALLFGQILGVSPVDVLEVAGMAVVAVAATIVLYRPLLLASVSPELAEARGVRSHHMEIVFLALVALATVMTLPIFGTLLVFSLMVGPPAAAQAFTRQPASAALVSVLIALLVTWLALALAYTTNWPVGFFVGALGALVYICGAAWSAWEVRRQMRPTADQVAVATDGTGAR